jgi:hypothetical protein
MANRIVTTLHATPRQPPALEAFDGVEPPLDNDCGEPPFPGLFTAAEKSKILLLA